MLVECLQSIFKFPTKIAFEIIVVDNHSMDDTVSFIHTHFPQVLVIENQQNVGFARGNNKAVKKAQGEYLFFLNSDTLLKKNAVDTLINFAKSANSDIASCQLNNSDGSIQPQGGQLPNLFNVFCWMTFIDDIPLISRFIPSYQQSRIEYFTKNHQMGWLAGTALLINRNVFRELKGFDENMFMYGEDVEFCMRAYDNKVKINYFSSPQIIHLGQGSGSSSKAILGEYQGLKYIFVKHKPTWQLPILRLWLKIGALLRLLIFGMMGGDEDKRIIYQQAYKLA
jgi:GT2 family glycosyltransferase